jgi:DNA-binding response OmpR family regulator
MSAIPAETTAQNVELKKLREGGSRPPVLCLDDDPAVLALCKAALTRAGFEADCVADGWDALKKLNERRYAAVLIDLFLPSLHGRTVLSLIQQSHPNVIPHLIIMTGLTDGAIDDLYGKVGGILRKPLKIDTLVEFVREVAAVDFDETMRIRAQV